MAEVYNMVGSLSQLLTDLRSMQITDFNSLGEIISFRNNYDNQLLQIKEQKGEEVCLEIETLKKRIIDFSTEYDIRVCEREAELIIERNGLDQWLDHYSTKQGNIFKRIYYAFKRYRLNKRKNVLFNHFEDEVKRPFQQDARKISSMKQDLSYIENNYDRIVKDRADSASMQLHIMKAAIEDKRDLLIGAIGEQKALVELQKLPDSYCIINDYKHKFFKPIYKKNTNEYIYSIQTDHIVIGPPGVFIIETKNWSSQSLQNIDLYSPVKQIHRTSHALFIILNNALEQGSLSSFKHHWGKRKISPRNILLMTNATTKKEFQFVKIRELHNVVSYVNYFEPILSEKQIQQLARLLL